MSHSSFFLMNLMLVFMIKRSSHMLATSSLMFGILSLTYEDGCLFLCLESCYCVPMWTEVFFKLMSNTRVVQNAHVDNS